MVMSQDQIAGRSHHIKTENRSCERVEEFKYLGTTRLRVFKNRLFRRIFGPTRDEVPGLWKKKLHNEELNDLYRSPNIIRLIKSRRTRKAGHVAGMGKRIGVYGVLVGKLE
jgi:hypothetical protein